MLLALLLLHTAFAAAVTGFCIAVTQGILFVAKEIGGDGSAARLQDAITPRVVPNLALIFGFLTLAGIINAFFVFGFGPGSGSVGTAIVAAWFAIKFAPKPNSPFYVRMTYGLLVRRSADYAKVKDHVRSVASRDVYERIERRFPELLGDWRVQTRR